MSNHKHDEVVRCPVDFLALTRLFLTVKIDQHSFHALSEALETAFISAPNGR